MLQVCGGGCSISKVGAGTSGHFSKFVHFLFSYVQSQGIYGKVLYFRKDLFIRVDLTGHNSIQYLSYG